MLAGNTAFSCSHLPCRNVMVFRRQYFSKSALDPPKNSVGHLRIMNVWLPRVLNCAAMLLCITRMAVITTMMENTPTSTPSSVSDERNLCAAIAPMAIEKLSRASARMLIRCLLISQGVHGVHARCAPCGKKSGQHAGQQRDQQRDGDDHRRHCRRHDFLERERRQPRDAQRDGSADQADAGRLDQ